MANCWLKVLGIKIFDRTVCFDTEVENLAVPQASRGLFKVHRQTMAASKVLRKEKGRNLVDAAFELDSLSGIP